MLKLTALTVTCISACQPPSGGCVLKLLVHIHYCYQIYPAAFRRLCVETHQCQHATRRPSPAAFRRLCVETPILSQAKMSGKPAAFRRLCVETAAPTLPNSSSANQPPSGGCVLKRTGRGHNRLPGRPAAFRRLCVETPSSRRQIHSQHPTSRLQAAVC